jgi:hypothetical protein
MPAADKAGTLPALVEHGFIVSGRTIEPNLGGESNSHDQLGSLRSLCRAETCQDALRRPGRPTLDGMTATHEEGQQPVVQLPERDPAALRAAVAKLDTAALAKFESDWTAATARARDEYSLMPARYFVEHWWTWVEVERWPTLAARLRDCERIVAESADRNVRRAAAAEISEILRRAESATR